MNRGTRLSGLGWKQSATPGDHSELTASTRISSFGIVRNPGAADNGWMVFLLLFALSLGICGCSGNEPIPVAVPDGASAADNQGSTVVVPTNGTGTPDADRSAKNGARGRDEVYVDEKGQKWFGKVPFDVFFDDPYAVATLQTPVTGTGATAAVDAVPVPPSDNQAAPQSTSSGAVSSSAASTPEMPADVTKPAESSVATPPVSPSAGGTGNWAGLIPVSVLEEEVKNIRNFLNENLQSVGNYNSAMLMIPPKAAALGVLAGVAMEHPENVSWKSDAVYVRDLAKQMNATPLQRGAKDQKRLLALFEAIADTLNRSRPAGLAEPPADDSFAEVSEMRLVMMRMEEAEKRMKTEAGTAASFASGKTMVQHEATLLATMTHTIMLPGYGYSDDKEFTGYGQTVVEAAKTILTASESDDFSSYELALSKISTTCQSCHSKYKND